MKEQQIPEEIKQKIEKYVKLYSSQPDDVKELSNIAKYGYSLSQEQLAAKEKEIERLKGLIGYAHQHGFVSAESRSTIEKSWQQFKTVNNL